MSIDRHKYRNIRGWIPRSIERLFYKKQKVVSVITENLSVPIDVYNVEVDDTHSYFHNVFGSNCDDLISENDAKTNNPEVYQKVWDWYQMGPLQRLQPFGRSIQIATRWSKADPIGRIKEEMATNPNAYKYESIEFTALDENGESTFPEMWPTEELVAKKANMSPHFWGSQYEQNPTTAGGSVIKEAWWKKWNRFTPVPGSPRELDFELPDSKFRLMVLDSAYTQNKRSNPTACLVFDVFEDFDEATQKRTDKILLIETYQKKMEFSELKRQAKEWQKKWKPDCFLIEEKSSGPMLISELREAGVFVEGVMPKPKEDKLSRLNSVSDVFASGFVYYLPTSNNRETVQQCSDFPGGRLDDCVDCVAYGVRRFRRGGFIRLPSDDSFSEEQPSVPMGRIY